MPEILEKIKKEGIDVSGEEPSWAQTYENMKVIVENFPTHIPNNYLEYYLYPNLTIKQTDPTYTRANQIMEGRLQQIDDTVERIKDGKATDLDYESSDMVNISWILQHLFFIIKRPIHVNCSK